MNRYGVAIAVIGASLLVRLALQPWLGFAVPYLHFFPAILIASWFGGFGPGLLATVAATATGAYIFLAPSWSFAVASLADRVSVPLFALAGVAVAWITGSMRRLEVSHARAAAQAVARAAELEAILEAIPAGIYVGTEAGIDRSNAAGLRMLGARSIADFNANVAELGARLRIRSPSTGEPLPADRLQFVRALRGESVVEEVVARRLDVGDDVVIRCSAAPIWSNGQVVGAVAVNTDVTAERRAAEELARSNETISAVTRRLQEVVANVPGVVWEAWGRPDATSQRIDFVSDYVETLLGYAPAKWTAVPNFWLTIVHPDDKERAADEARAIFESRTGGRSAFRWIAHDGRTVWVESYSTVVLDAGGQPVGMRGVTLDISDRKRLEFEREGLLEREQKARADAVSANRLKDDFLATLSHELRTPLNAILGYTRMLHRGILEGDRRNRALEIVERNASALSRMVADVLDVSRIVTGKIRLNPRRVDLPLVVEEALATIRPAADAKGIRMQVVLDPGALPVAGDPDRLQQVVWNLLSNAVRFTKRDGRVQVRLERVHAHMELAVADTGEGIAADFLPHVFERFRQADSRFSREHNGLGLGLAISRELVELHGGTIKALSEGPGKGATFVVRLPVMSVRAGVDPEPEHPVASIVPDHDDRRLSGVSVLVVDDDPDALSMMRDALEASGATVCLKDGARAALAFLQETLPDVIVTDLGMPGIDGFALANEIRRAPVEALKTVPIAALTAYSRSEDRDRALTLGFQMHLAKPIDPGELVEAIAALAGIDAADGKSKAG